MTGGISPEEIFSALEPVEQKLISKRAASEDNGEAEKPERPFRTEYPALAEDVDKTIQYPSSEEKFGRVALGWRLPNKLWEDVTRMHALKLLGE